MWIDSISRKWFSGLSGGKTIIGRCGGGPIRRQTTGHETLGVGATSTALVCAQATSTIRQHTKRARYFTTAPTKVAALYHLSLLTPSRRDTCHTGDPSWELLGRFLFISTLDCISDRPGRSKCMLGSNPTSRPNSKVARALAPVERVVTRAGQLWPS